MAVVAAAVVAARLVESAVAEDVFLRDDADGAVVVVEDRETGKALEGAHDGGKLVVRPARPEVLPGRRHQTQRKTEF